MNRRLKGNQPCPLCHSSDAVSHYLNEDSDGVEHVSGYCFSCSSYLKPDLVGDYDYSDLKSEEFNQAMDIETQEEIDRISELEMRGWKERRLPKSVCEMYGVRSEFDADGQLVARHYPITQDEGDLVGYKTRIVSEKKFFTVGKNSNKVEMFGQHIFPSGGKYLVVTGGEEDAIAMQKAFKDKNSTFTTAVISPTVGEPNTAQQIRANYDYITSFDRVVLMLDNDKVGKEAAEEAVKILKPGQGYIAKLEYKDPCEYLMNGRQDKLLAAFWNAERYSPIDVTTLGQLWEDFENAVEEDIIPLPPAFKPLAELMGGGPALGELTVIGALTSVGKSSLLNNWVYNIATKTSLKCGLVYLESSPKELVQSFLSIHTETNLALKRRDELDMKALKTQFLDFIGNDSKIVNVNHNGSFTTIEEMFDKIRWLIKGAGCDVVFLDPVQQAVPSNENGVIDSFMDSLLKLCKETGAAIVVVSHMKKPADDRPHDVSEYDLKGSSSINQVAFNTILMSRDKINPNPNIRNTTKLQLVKCRRTGMSNAAGWIRYDPQSSTLHEANDPYLEADMAELGSEEMQDYENYGK